MKTSIYAAVASLALTAFAAGTVPAAAVSFAGDSRGPTVGAPDFGTSVLFTNREVGNPLFADVGSMSNAAQVTSAGDTLVGWSYVRNGFQAKDGSLNSFEFSLANPLLGFDLLRFQFRALGAGSNLGGSFTITAYDQNNNPDVFTTLVTANKGTNRIVLTADAGELITRVTVSGVGDAQVTDVSRFGIGNIETIAAVPGPIAGAGLPALLALGGFVWTRRRKAAAVT